MRIIEDVYSPYDDNSVVIDYREKGYMKAVIIPVNDSQTMKDLQSIINEEPPIDHFPNIQETGILLQELFESVNGEGAMGFIEKDDEINTEENRKILEKDIEKYGLEDVITFNEADEGVITAYGDLMTRFKTTRR